MPRTPQELRLGLLLKIATRLELGLSTKGDPTMGILASTQCSSYLKMYDGTWYSGSVLYLRSKYQWHNLVNYGFNQRTTSFKVGACSTYFADYSNGGGAWYPTWATQAYDQSPTMISGWNNDVSTPTPTIALSG